MLVLNEGYPGVTITDSFFEQFGTKWKVTLPICMDAKISQIVLFCQPKCEASMHIAKEILDMISEMDYPGMLYTFNVTRTKQSRSIAKSLECNGTPKIFITDRNQCLKSIDKPYTAYAIYKQILDLKKSQ